MYIRNYQGKLVKFEWKLFRGEKQMYKALWKILYNMDIVDVDFKMNKLLIDYIKE